VRRFVVAFVPGNYLLLILLSFINIAAQYCTENGLSGARKRSAEGEDDDEDSGDDGRSISLGSHDTDSDDGMSMPPKTSTPGKKGPTPSKDAAAATVTKPTKTGDKEVDTITARIQNLQVSKQLNWGFDFTGSMPYFWWTYNFDGVRHLKMEILMSVAWHEDIEPSVSESGDYLIVYCKLPDYFLNLGRLLGYYHDADLDGPTFGHVF
jgi:hypothetical protein